MAKVLRCPNLNEADPDLACAVAVAGRALWHDPTATNPDARRLPRFRVYKVRGSTVC